VRLLEEERDGENLHFWSNVLIDEEGSFPHPISHRALLLGKLHGNNIIAGAFASNSIFPSSSSFKCESR
jgi:hypothetical protein